MGTGASKKQHALLKAQVDHTWQTLRKQLNLSDRWTFAKAPLTHRDGWYTVRIYVSSTFKDFEFEREYLANEVFPELRAWCTSQRIHLIVSDLRLGLPDGSESASFLNACLSDLDECFDENVYPYFLSLIGQRVGWIPIEEEIPEQIQNGYNWVPGLSLCELEIVNAAFTVDNPNALFMIREQKFVKSLPVQYKEAFIDFNPVADVKVSRLKMEILKRFPDEQIYRYSCDVKGVNEKTNVVELGNMEPFAQTIKDFFKRCIERQTPELILGSGDDAIEDCSILQHSFITTKAEHVVGGDEWLQKLTTEITRDGVNYPLIVTGEAGIGKTSMLALLCDRLAKEISAGKAKSPIGESWSLFYHFAGSTPSSNEIQTFFRRILQFFDANEVGRKKPHDFYAVLRGYLCGYSGVSAIIVVDGLDEFDDQAHQWIPPTLAPTIRLICSADEQSAALRGLRQRISALKQMTVPCQSFTNRKALVEKWLKESHKKHTLQNALIESMLSSEHANNPLWLRIALLASENWHITFPPSENVAAAAPSMHELLPSLTEMTLEKCEEESVGELCAEALALFKCSASGLLETELLDLLGEREHGHITRLSAYQWSLVYQALKPFIGCFGANGEGRMNFSHVVLRHAVEKRYFQANQEIDVETTSHERNLHYHGKLATYFAKCEDLDRKVEEYIFQLSKAEMFGELAEALCDWPMLQRLFDEAHSTKLFFYWEQIPQGIQGMDSKYCSIFTQLKNDKSGDIDVRLERMEMLVKILLQSDRFFSALNLSRELMEVDLANASESDAKAAQYSWLHAKALDGLFSQHEHVLTSQLPQINKIKEILRQCLTLCRRLPKAPENSRLIAAVLLRLAFYHCAAYIRGDRSTINSDSESDEDAAIYCANESASIFEELDDFQQLAVALIAKARASTRASRLQLEYLMKAEEILLLRKGEAHYELGQLYLDVGVLNEQQGNMRSAFDYFHKRFALFNETYGAEHRETQSSLAVLREPAYKKFIVPSSVDDNELYSASTEKTACAS